MTIEEMMEKKTELGYTNQQLAELSGVPIGTLQKIFSGFTKAPRRETIQALEKVFRRSEYNKDLSMTSMVKEPSVAYGQTEGYTLKDYLELPEERRVELIDGVFYDMAAPTTIHQAIAGFIYKQLLDHVFEKGGECMPFISPVDVQLDRDEYTVVQPDVMIVCKREMFQNGRVFGAPDFLCEVLSPSTRMKDMTLKHYKYANAGVREYWLVDPKKKCVIVYDLEQEAIPVIYGEQDVVPVGIWNGECRIDFPKLYEHIGFLYESI